MNKIPRSLKLALFITYSLLLFAGGWKVHETAAPLLRLAQLTQVKP